MTAKEARHQSFWWRASRRLRGGVNFGTEVGIGALLRVGPGVVLRRSHCRTGRATTRRRGDHSTAHHTAKGFEQTDEARSVATHT